MQICTSPLRVVVTGIGLLTSIGNNPREVWESVRESKSGIRLPISGFGVEAGVNDKIPAGVVLNGEMPHSRSQILAVKATEYALRDAGMDLRKLDSKRIGVSVSTSKGDLYDYLTQPSGFFLNQVNSNLISFLHAEGPCLNVVAACATGLQSIQWGARWIAQARADVVVAGASDSVLNPFLVGAYAQCGILAKARSGQDPTKILRPFDRTRSGTVLGEGSAVVVLESYEKAKKRGARIYAEILSAYNGIDLYHELRMNPTGVGVAHAFKCLLKEARVSKENIDYINLHGTGTVWNDRVETRGVKMFFGDTVRRISFSSTKPFTGHMVGASGAVELILSLLAIENHFVPPTLNLENPDPECDLDYTPQWGREKNLRSVICLSYGFGGHVSALLARRV